MGAAATPVRIAWAVLFALLLSARSLAPAGFMPAFDHGAVTIVACPDAEGAATMPAHHHGERKRFHQLCPYAAASALGALAAEWVPFVALALFVAVLFLDRSSRTIALRAARERPPSRGPPLRT
jgi:ABC-type sulfate transport system permease subunit